MVYYGSGNYVEPLQRIITEEGVSSYCGLAAELLAVIITISILTIVFFAFTPQLIH